MRGKQNVLRGRPKSTGTFDFRLIFLSRFLKRLGIEPRELVKPASEECVVIGVAITQRRAPPHSTLAACRAADVSETLSVADLSSGMTIERPWASTLYRSSAAFIDGYLSQE